MSSLALAYSHESTPQKNFADRVSELLDKIDCRVIKTDEEREAVGRLRYEAYLHEGAIPSNSAKSFLDPYDDKQNVWTFGFYIGDELASSVRMHVATREHRVFPSLSVFSDLLEPELDAGKTIVDSTRFVTERRLSRLFPALPYATLRLCWITSVHFEAEHFLAAVRVEHQPFYRRVFNHYSICGPRDYPSLSKPITLMTVNPKNVEDRVYRRYPFFRSTYFERRMLFERDPSLVPASIAAKLIPAERQAFQFIRHAG